MLWLSITLGGYAMIEACTEQNALALLLRATREGGALQPFHIQSGDEPVLRFCLEEGLLGEEDDEDLESPIAYLLTPAGEEVVERGASDEERDAAAAYLLAMDEEARPPMLDKSDDEDEGLAFPAAYLISHAGQAPAARVPRA
jgi:hypothetical protein